MLGLKFLPSPCPPHTIFYHELKSIVPPLYTDAPVLVDTDVAPDGSKWPIYGEPLVRVCPLQSNTPAQYTWRRYRITDNAELDISTDVRFSENGRRLEIDAYRPEEHNGVYVCHASNPLGTKEYSDANLFYLHAECKCMRMEAYRLILYHLCI